MKKPRIILADTDDNYLVSLEVRFLEALGEEAEIEVITDPEYFYRKFSGPCSADVLIVSQSLYSRELQRQDIGNFFILTEKIEEGATGDLSERKIYKYTSPKNIYKQVADGCGTILESKELYAQRTRVVLVYSPLGGVGKTTLSLGISAGLAQGFQKVLYIDAERLSTFPHFLSDQNTVSMDAVNYADLRSGNLYDRVRHLIRTDHFDYFPPLSAALSSWNLEISFYRYLIESVCKKQRYDLVVVDTDSVFDPDKAALITLADTVVIPVRQTADAVCSVNALLHNIRTEEEGKYLFVCNDYDKAGENALVSPSIKAEFSVSEYVGHMREIEKMTLEELAGQSDIQKICYLIS